MSNSIANVTEIRSAAVLGAGTMGAGIAMVLAEAGIAVLLKENRPAALELGLATIDALYRHAVEHNLLSAEQAAARRARITPTLVYDDLVGVDLVVEAAYESMALKREIFAELDRVCRPGAILASNTSTLDIDEIASVTKRPETVIGTHFFTPPTTNRLLEIVPGRATAPAVVESCMALAQRMGKVAVLVGNSVGFVANRMFLPYHREAEFLVEEGAGVVAVDQALMEFGMGLGPLLILDLVGLDVGQLIRNEHRHRLAAGTRQAFAEEVLHAAGRLGRKSGAGWYLYDRRMHPTEDPESAALVHAAARQRGIPQRAIAADEIVERCMFALINEGAKVVGEGVAHSVADVDLIMTTGYGFPLARGGPMQYADSLGLPHIYERVCAFEREFGPVWRPAPLLKQLAEQGRTFAALDQQAR